ncbi:unnamed protein product [Ophioblennius macclurei]
MAGPGLFLSLAVCALLAHQIQAKNDAPCQASRWNNGFKTFLQHHIRSGTPRGLDQNQWESYIRNNGGCDRPTQSFLHPDELEKVKSVCSDKGGKVYKENLCISQQPFTFVTVKSEPGTCSIRSVQEETKHLILACEVLENQCVPVHFEGNPQDVKPSNNARGCQETRSKAHANSWTWLWLLCVVPLVNYGY